MTHSSDLQAHTDAVTEYMAEFKRLSYVFPRYTNLDAAFNRVLGEVVSSRVAGFHGEGRWLGLTGGTRSGKTHDLKQLLRAFSDNPSKLDGGIERKCLRISLRATTSWKHLGSAILKGAGYFSDLDHRSADLIWRRAETQLQREGIFVIHLDEAQHLFNEKKRDQIETILIGLKDLMKRIDWPILLVLSGVPSLLDYLNRLDELVALMEPVSYVDVSYDEDSLNEADAVVCAFAEVAELDVSSLRNEDVFNRMIHASARRWGRFIELVIQSMAQAKASGKSELSIRDLANTFQRWTGAVDGGNVFLVENPYRIQVDKLHQT
jgi:hypothetical protein